MSYANSRIPESAQHDVHEGLRMRVERHLREPFRKPIADYNREAFELSLAGWNGHASLILDAGCGVGHSTIELARQYPDHWVIGVDQSIARLTRRKPYPDALMPQNLVFVRADLVDYWRLLGEAGLHLDRHYLLYPNPWPKVGHLARRWHAHPVFPHILKLGGLLECRTNWLVYASEFAFALDIALAATGPTATLETFSAERPLTPFERKYRDSGQMLYRVSIPLVCARDEASRPSRNEAEQEHE